MEIYLLKQVIYNKFLFIKKKRQISNYKIILYFAMKFTMIELDQMITLINYIRPLHFV